MASASLSTQMETDIRCPICLACLKHPMVLGCGHSFCQGCITDYCEKWEPLGDLECPLCKLEFQKGDIQPNWQLAKLVEKIKLTPLSSRKEHLCRKHKLKLHLFCKEDEKMVCILCERAPEHEGHTVLLLEEVTQQYKDKFINCLETLRIEKKNILVYIEDAKNKSHDMLKRMESERQKTADEFRILHQLLHEQEKHLLAHIEEVEKEVARERDEHLARLLEELSSLESFIQEMEEKHQQPESELLQDVRSTLQRYEKKETFQNREAFSSELNSKLWDCCYNPFLESAMKQIKDTLACPLLKQRATVTLDPASASSRLVLSPDRKSIRWQSTALDLFKDPQKHYGFVLGREGFAAGCHFWEVLVGSADGWAVGVARKSVKGRVTLTPEEGIWAVGRWKGQYKAFIKGTDPSLTLRGELRKIRICLNYDHRQVAFFSTYRAALLYEFSEIRFSGETLLPFFAVYGDASLWLHF
ncbi:tripartite motif-containing protein 10-like [Paroedura picta]|uniref:tripartite motif-containing protein 10-like n=1 Tax=Paroedura picta TaxID=143630 RepID=UPI0040567E66